MTLTVPCLEYFKPTPDPTWQDMIHHFSASSFHNNDVSFPWAYTQYVQVTLTGRPRLGLGAKMT